MPRYVIFTESFFTERDWNRFGCSEFAVAGYEVVCVQLARAFKVEENLRSRGAFQAIRTAVTPEDSAALNNIVASLDRRDVVFMQVLLSERSREFFRMLRGAGIRYTVATVGELPIRRMKSRMSAVSWKEYFELRVEDLLGSASRLKRSLQQLFFLDWDGFQLQSPFLWLTAGSAPSPFVSRWPRPWAARRIPIAGNDYIITQRLGSRSAVKATTVVFLDEAYADHPDYEILGQRSPVTAARYWASLESFFKKLECETGFSVIIAPHPKSNGVAPEISTHRWQTGKTTPELVQESAIVLSHASTAISFAVIFRKPIIFLTTDEIEKSMYRRHIARMSSFFAWRRVNVDRLSTSDLQIPAVSESVYAGYEHAYLRAPEAVVGSPWEALRNEMEK
ncbi:MAG: hypothetical protein NTZ72_19755 [Afipia sp.]|nr:hypothetical protein [Afipia sp.]